MNRVYLTLKENSYNDTQEVVLITTSVEEVINSMNTIYRDKDVRNRVVTVSREEEYAGITERHDIAIFDPVNVSESQWPMPMHMFFVLGFDLAAMDTNALRLYSHTTNHAYMHLQQAEEANV